METFNNLPTPIKALLALMGGTSILGAVAMIDPRLMGIVAVGMIVLVALLAGFYFIVQMLEKRKSRAMAGNIQRQASSVPTGINDPAKRARLDELRRSFENGLEKFRSSGKDVYKLPWYMFVGEPGSGKTEAIRHSNVGFPPGLQDELQGSGGTINMHWWFTNQAVFLDTAGRLMFEEIQPGETSEWREFLQLLRRNRPNCPVNGLLLVIPTDSLIRDNADTVARKAAKIAQQLDTIQRTLDVRFPVFVLITKCDLLNGFREFFQEFSDLQAQHQIFGWSNPGDRDEVFRPDLVDQHIETVIGRIKKRRLGLLKDPVPRNPGDRRADEVDSLFALPQSLSLIAPRLRRYLEMIFVAGEWSAKPLFLRGIYFTSAMREGAALDQELAEAIGVSFDALPEGKPWERERAYFLRDLFTEKVFRERGLVTRATNTKRMLRQRQGMLLGFGAVALAAFLGFSFYQHNQLQESIGIHEQYWRGAAKDWSPGKWHPLLKADFAGGTEFRYLGDQPVDGFTEKSLVDVQASLQSIATRPINTGWVFKPLAGLTNIKDDRTKAQHIVLNASVVAPVLTAARQRMQNADTTSADDPTKAATNLLDESRAVAALLHIEADAVHKPDSADGVPAYFSTLLGYSLNKEVADLDKISVLLTTNYAKESWPPAWTALGSANLAANRPIQKALERIKSYATLAGKTHETHLAVIQDLLAALKEFQSKERELNDRPTLEAKSDSLKTAMEGLYTELETKRTALDQSLQKADKAGVLSGSSSSLKAAYDQVIASGKSQGDEAFALVQKACAPYLGDDKNKLFYDVDSALKQQRVQIAKTLEGALSVEDVAALKALDDAYLADSGDHKTRIYTLRWKLYEDTHSQLHRDLVFKDLVGTEWRAAADIKTHMQDVTKFVEDNKVKLKDPLKACDYFLQIGERSADSKLITAYLAEVREKLGSQLQFPLVWPPTGNVQSKDDLNKAGNTLTDIEKDIASDWVKGLEPEQKARLVRVGAAIAPVEKFRADLPGSAGSPGSFTVSLPNYNDQMSLSGERSALNEWRGIVVGGIVLRTSVATDTPVGSFPVDGDFSVTFKQYPDGTGGSHIVSGGGSWSVLRLLKQGGYVKQFDGGKRYRIGFPLEGHLIWFEFTFEKPLPDLAAWPTRDKVVNF